MTSQAPLRINIEFVSAYPSRPLRGEDAYAAIIGDVLARMAGQLGHQVSREYYVNDAGPQADALARGVYARVLTPSAFEDDEITALATTVRKRLPEALFDSPEASWLSPLRSATVAAAMERITADLEALGVAFDVFTAESSLETKGALRKLLDDFASKAALMDAAGNLLQTAPEPPLARLMLDTTARGDLRPRALTDSDGRYTYYAADLAYHADKMARSFDLMIDVFRKDHAAYAPGLVAGVDLISASQTKLSVCLIDPVRPPSEADPSPRVAAPLAALPKLEALLAFYGAPLLRRLFLSHAPGKPLALACDPATRRALKAAEERQLAALALPETGASDAPDALAEIASAFEARTPHKLMAATDALASASLAARSLSKEAKSGLLAMRAALGFT
ncbi:hypothetical protein [uncultured Lentibacter sp.]|jgi:arginyl-tRNA synthetase|uniref:hypothetical protein n=1 Tax=uncultured Lentibacter sp. TaxID=1659309 RepID=UPI00262CA774|nr:hypothetical protein [uncultured Lentibacter sp.]